MDVLFDNVICEEYVG